MEIKKHIAFSWEGLLNSYAQVFFSNNKFFAIILLLVSFFDLEAGLSGVFAVLVGQLTAYLFNFNMELVKDGTYTYNSAMVGVAIGIFYDFNFSFFTVLLVSSVLVFFITIWLTTSFAKSGLPFLSIPFLLTVWILILGAGNFSALVLKEKEVLTLAKYYPEAFNWVTNVIADLPFSNSIFLYFRSLGAIFFQYNDLAGLLITIGILMYSRISFVLSILGFLIGFLFYQTLEGDFSQLIYSYIGFNFILTAIALGGFFVVPSRKSFLMLLFIIPIIALIISALHSLFSYFGLPLYSLPFNIVVFLFISVMQQRLKSSELSLVAVQQFSPEKNHYKFFNSVERFKSDTYYHIALPIMGKWNISQGYDGQITHKGEWQHALDFDVRDEENATFNGRGDNLKDYYCYDLPILAPAAGYVMEVLDGIADNKIGEVNLDDNWGNTLIIKHGEFLYSKLSHLKKLTFKAKVGDYVKKGDVVAYLGSSGRSPEPHLHFQMQTTPYVGSKTLEYPISYYLTEKNNEYKFHSFAVPQENETVSNVKTTPVLAKAFDFIPGKTLEFIATENGIEIEEKWEIFVTALNQTYIYCPKTKATAYFINNGTMFYFTDFYGNKKSLLHLFYLAAHKVLLGYYNNVEIEDNLLIDSFFSPITKALHDFTAPLFHYCKVKYHFQFTSSDQEHNPEKVTFKTVSTGLFFEKDTDLFGKSTQQTETTFKIENNQIEHILVAFNKRTIEFKMKN